MGDNRFPDFQKGMSVKMQERKVILSADSTCDLGDELKARYDVNFYPFHILLEEQDYQDNVDITTKEIFAAY